MKIKSNTIDIIALSSSLICAIHCAAVPLILSFSSLSNLHFFGNPYIEWSFISLGFVFLVTSLWPSYKKVHRRAKPLVYAILGFLFFALGRLNLTELWEISNTVIGGIMLALAHYLNWKSVQSKDRQKI
ncbi:MerC domain-containing protein [Gelidibacter sp.]|uniref:MerC domain-containing protein n=1 Tax=Gelidibacter sp. TaxID=2018083 RepID=UPI0032676BAE